MKLIVKNAQVRKDGKYSCVLIYEGGPNMFGGHYPSKRFNKLLTPEGLHRHAAVADSIENFPRELMGKL